jgi:hypothetical protein
VSRHPIDCSVISVSKLGWKMIYRDESRKKGNGDLSTSHAALREREKEG